MPPPLALHGAFRSLRPCTLKPHLHPRRLVTLAIETSCDDTSVAILETKAAPHTAVAVARLHFHRKVTSNNASFGGVHPLQALESHQENLANLVRDALAHLPRPTTRPDFVSVTRGPGMRSNLFTGLDTAKGLAVAWNVPLVGVNHMQGHALTPRLVQALDQYQHHSHHWDTMPDLTTPVVTQQPDYPFLSVLASGGHTLLIHSTTLVDQTILGTTTDVAVGECLDKMARVVLPKHVLQSANGAMYGALLENFAFPTPCTALSNSTAHPPRETAQDFCHRYRMHYAYTVPRTHEEELQRNKTKWGWAFNQPLLKASGGLKNKDLDMSFSGLMTAVERAVRYRHHQSTGKLTKIERSLNDISLEERRDMAEFSMRAAFEHVAGRVAQALRSTPVTSVIMSGGVGANHYFRYVLSSTLTKHGFGHVHVLFPPPALCSDNAAMIAWAGTEMYQAGHRNDLSIRAIRKWPLDKLLHPPDEKIT